ncbi:transglutaminase family protein [Candidatus Microgenomates bacterium]|nr:transglutaminase family protein [Candidatus Microgenomates bacterium]
MKRFLLSAFLLTTFYLLHPTSAHAQEEFSTSVVATYDVTDDGRTSVSHEITLTNNFSTIHAASYVFNLEGTHPENVIARQGTKDLAVDVTAQQNTTTIKVQFADAVVGKNKGRTFTISYQDTSVATKNGKVWEITIPKLSGLENYSSYSLLLSVPSQFGEPAYLSPKPIDTLRGERLTYSFSAQQLASSGVVAAFGDFQVFGFELLYHLHNPYDKTGETEIALPPDNTFQKIYYTQVYPRPVSIRLDEEGNWLAKYRLKGKENLDVKAAGSVQLFAYPQENRTHAQIDKEKYLADTTYWQTNDPKIINAARNLRTAHEIYDFVVTTLTYDYNRVRPDVNRLGAAAALENPSNAICMEFTDLFIAVARAAGIPAREVNGYAYTENPEIQPLSLVADVLHAWPEYWDSERNIWIPVDPTWGNTTGGLDFFSKLDLSHFAFVFHGSDPEQPLPAGSYKIAENPQKDVNVFFGSLPETTQNLQLSIHLRKQFIPFLPFKGILSLKNNGSAAMYDLRPQFSSASGKVTHQENIEFLPPLTTDNLEFSWSPTSFLFGENQISVHVGSQDVKYTMGVDFLIWQIFGIFFILTIVTAFILTLVFSRKKLKNVFRKSSKITTKVTGFSRRLPFPKQNG